MPQKTSPSAPTLPARLPWLTLVVAALAVGTWFWPGVAEVFIYDRSRILDGQLWRIVTGHWVHFSASHLLWNLAILVPAGAWLERRSADALRWTLLFSPFAISFALLAFAPSLSQYAGISGVASGVLVALAVDGLCTEPRARWFWLAVVVLFTAKTGFDAFTSRPFNPDLATRGITSVPLAHLVGALVGAGAALICRVRKPSDKR